MKKIQTLKQVWKLCVPYHGCIISLLILLIINQSINAVSPLIFGSIVTAVTSPEMDTRAFVLALICLLGLSCLRTGLGYTRERFQLQKLDYELPRHLSKMSMEKFFNISMGQHHLGHSVIKRNVISKGESAIFGIVKMGIYEIIPTILTILIPIVFLLVKVPVVGLCVLVSIICFTYYTVKFNSSFVPKLRSLDTLENVVSKKQGEMISNAEVVYVNAQEERVKRECDNENAGEALQGRPIWLSYLAWFFGGQWFIAISQSICLGVAGYLVFKKQISPGMFATVFLWIGSALGTIGNISNIQRNLTKSLAPISKYFRFLDYEPDIVMPIKPVPIECLKGRIEFRNVSFTYKSRTEKDDLNDDLDAVTATISEKSEEVPAIDGISFVLESGMRHAFVGSSGAGKSTLVGLILRAFDPQSGHILIDGVDLRMIDYRELRRNVGLVPQDVSLFDGTVRYNITFGLNGSAKNVTDADLDSIAKLSRISEFSNKLEKGWETMIGERGIKLSGGQRQRIGIARALIKNPHILIFDEATSSLDTENETRIRESIKEASVGKTTIIIAHRLATVRDADKIFVFDEGKVVGQGTHDELLQTNEFYQRLVHNQVIMA